MLLWLSVRSIQKKKGSRGSFTLHLNCNVGQMSSFSKWKGWRCFKKSGSRQMSLWHPHTLCYRVCCLDQPSCQRWSQWSSSWRLRPGPAATEPCTGPLPRAGQPDCYRHLFLMCSLAAQGKDDGTETNRTILKRRRRELEKEKGNEISL